MFHCIGVAVKAATTAPYEDAILNDSFCGSTEQAANEVGLPTVLPSWQGVSGSSA
jgi:hypothetical protein